MMGETQDTGSPQTCPWDTSSAWLLFQFLCGSVFSYEDVERKCVSS